ncbi:hypothetical protein FJ418_09055 [Mesorhizobium sp. B2-8-3]|nr:hypothetical protein FJ418_09055 [Mesorhizobium sp. B2-8-3]
MSKPPWRGSAVSTQLFGRSFVLKQFRTEGYGEVAEPKRLTLSWNCFLLGRNFRRKTASHFSWNCFLPGRNFRRKTASHFSWNCVSAAGG